MQDKLNRQAAAYINGLRATVQALWRKACEFDGIPADSQFVIFSEANKFHEFYNIAMRRYLEACREYESGGYVGLQIQNGRTH